MFERIDASLRAVIDRVFDAFAAAGGEAVIVGGFVRDAVMGAVSKDVDFEVFGLEPAEVGAVIAGMGGSADMVGESFGVFKARIEGFDFDFAIPRRREVRVGDGHADFEVEFDPHMSFEDAARRRDFRFNAMGIRRGWVLVDPFGGVRDIDAGVIRIVDAGRFVDDPLRVLRAVQFASRFGFRADGISAMVFRVIADEFASISPERVWIEFEKMAAGRFPDVAMDVLFDSGWIRHFPMVELIGIEQDEIHHPEGDAWVHTKLVMRAAAVIADEMDFGRADRVALVLAAMLHDVGKFAVMEGFRFPGHADVSAEMAEEWMESIRAPKDVIGRVVEMVREHMAMVGGDISRRAVRRMVRRMRFASLADVAAIVDADHAGRGSASVFHLGDVLREMAANGVESEAVDIVMGRHLIDLGMRPGPGFGPILHAAREAQMDDVFSDVAGGLAWLRSEGWL